MTKRRTSRTGFERFTRAWQILSVVYAVVCLLLGIWIAFTTHDVTRATFAEALAVVGAISFRIATAVRAAGHEQIMRKVDGK